MLRVVGGHLGGRRIKTPQGRATRPTSERVREALFNVLQHLDALGGARVLDLFAGSGALGIEALSRGAAHATFIESHGRTAALIRGNLRALEIPESYWSVKAVRAEGFLDASKEEGGWTLIFMDPPYGADNALPALSLLVAHPGIPAEALVVVEAAAREPAPEVGGLEQIQVNRYGDTQVIYLRKRNIS